MLEAGGSARYDLTLLVIVLNASDMKLYYKTGNRLYLNDEERAHLWWPLLSGLPGILLTYASGNRAHRAISRLCESLICSISLFCRTIFPKTGYHFSDCALAPGFTLSALCKLHFGLSLSIDSPEMTHVPKHQNPVQF